MRHDIEHIKKGDVVYVPFPLDNLKEDEKTAQAEESEQVDPREKKDRPALVLWRVQNSFVVCSITSKFLREHEIKLTGRDLDSGRIGYDPSFIRPNIITTISRDCIREKIGTLKPQKLQEVVDKVKELIDAEPEEAPVPKPFERAKRKIR